MKKPPAIDGLICEVLSEGEWVEASWCAADQSYYLTDLEDGSVTIVMARGVTDWRPASIQCDAPPAGYLLH